MPVVDMSLKLLMSHVCKDGASVAPDDLIRQLPHMGCPVEGIAVTREYRCGACGKIDDRTAAQGPPLICANCGIDFRKSPQQLADLGENRVLRLELLSVRPDIFDPGGLARLIRGYLGIQPGLRKYDVSPPRIEVHVNGLLSREQSYRPFIACVVLRNASLDHDEMIKVLMNLQEDLHWALGRDRKLASIGAYDLGALTGTKFRYDAVEPDAVRFVPLGFPPDRAPLTLRDILEQHKTGEKYAHLLKSFDRYPLLRDEAGVVLSMPPIINSEATRVTEKTRDLFIDVTGTSNRSVDRALNIVVTSLADVMPAAEIEAVRIVGPEQTRETPDLQPVRLELRVQDAADTIGVGLDAGQLADLLARMGHGVDPVIDANQLSIAVPAYRIDVMHAVDLIEDAAIAYGYNNLAPQLVPTFTVGRPRAIEEQSAAMRRILTGLGFHQVMTLTLSNESASFDRWRIPKDDPIRERSVQIENPISVEQTICRVSLLPGLLETLSINKQYDLPQHIFEVGDCCRFDPSAETGACEERFFAASMIGPHVGYADIRAVSDALAHEIGRPMTVRACEHPSFIPGRVASLRLDDGTDLGRMGEIHPEILEAYGLRHAVAAIELNLASLLRER